MGARERLVELIAESGMTQAEIARRMGEDPQWVNNRVVGDTAIKADEIPRFADAVGCSPSAFFGRSALADVLLATFMRVLSDMPASYRRELLDLVAREDERHHPAPYAGAAQRQAPLRRAIAERSARYMARSWEQLPEEEQEFLWEMVEARRRLHERDAGRQE